MYIQKNKERKKAFGDETASMNFLRAQTLCTTDSNRPISKSTVPLIDQWSSIGLCLLKIMLLITRPRLYLIFRRTCRHAAVNTPTCTRNNTRLVETCFFSNELTKTSRTPSSWLILKMIFFFWTRRCRRNSCSNH